VLEATLELVAARGIAGASVDAIAAESGVSKATIYNRWGSKEELCLEAIRSMHEDVPEPDSGDARADVLMVLRDVLRPRGGKRMAKILPRLVGEAADNRRLARAWRQQIIAPRRARLVRMLERAVEQGQLAEGLDSELAADLLLGPIFYRRLVTGGPLPADELPEQLVNAVWAAFGAPEGRRSSERRSGEGLAEEESVR
jgi:AcrR family transcriptional regulator